MHELVVHNLEKIAELCRLHGVKRLFLVGSAAGDRFDPAQSDVDFLVVFEPFERQGWDDPYFKLLADLESLLGRPVDLIEPQRWNSEAGYYLNTWGPGPYYMRIAVAGLDANSAALSVASSNIANVDTTGYKTSSADFSTLLSSVIAGPQNEESVVESSINLNLQDGACHVANPWFIVSRSESIGTGLVLSLKRK